MRQHLQINNIEHTFGQDTPLISTTDLHGNINFVNDAFQKISGYTREELIGKPHNIVRHPDVPSAVFGDMWSKLKAGNPWIGIVKNRCKDGGFYWVQAYVTPILENGNCIGYQSVRTLPSIDRKQQAEQVYNRLNKGKRRISFKDVSAGSRAALIGVGASIVPVVAGAMTDFDPVAVSVSGGLMALVSIGLASAAMSRLKSLAEHSKKTIDSVVLREMFADSTAYGGQLKLEILTLQARAQAANIRVNYSVSELETHGGETVRIAAQTNEAITRQVEELDKVSVHINELSVAIEEVAHNATMTSDETKAAADIAAQGQSVVNGTVSSINELAENVRQAAQKISELHSATRDIASATGVITEIADQTNLLALNAAIEAARAGEQGRGFAVVADEVRELAKRTQESTKTIDSTIARLGKEAEEVVQVMDSSLLHVQGCVDQANQAGESLQSIISSVGNIADMSAMIAAASTEQSSASEELASNVRVIQSAAALAKEAAENTEKSSVKLANTSRDIVQSVTF